VSIELRAEVKRLAKVVDAQGTELEALNERAETLEALVGELSKAVRQLAEPEQAEQPDQAEESRGNGKKGSRARG
jgi:outer membrane murein-binding lipoprotein Lpp